MNGDASLTMLINRGLLPHEEKRLGPLDRDISNALIDAGIKTRCGWRGRDEGGGRILALVDWTKDERTIMEIPSADILTISDQALLERLRKCLT
jgi:hypothetical protein